MKISVVTVCYNSASTIEYTIKSVLAQDYNNIEFIVIDGKSTDNTVDVIKKYENNIAHFISEKDEGIYDAINKGIGCATGDVVGLLHADDFFSDNQVISKIVSQLKAEGADALYGDLQYVDQLDVNKIIRNWKSDAFKSSKFLRGWMPPHPTFYAKRELFKIYGGYRTELRISADYELMLRFLYKHHIKVTYLPEVLVKMRVGGESNVSLKNRLLANKEDRIAWEMNNLKPNLFTFILKPIRKIGQFLS